MTRMPDMNFKLVEKNGRCDFFILSQVFFTIVFSLQTMSGRTKCVTAALVPSVKCWSQRPSPGAVSRSHVGEYDLENRQQVQNDAVMSA